MKKENGQEERKIEMLPKCEVSVRLTSHSRNDADFSLEDFRLERILQVQSSLYFHFGDSSRCLASPVFQT